MSLEFACIIGLTVFVFGLAIRVARLEKRIKPPAPTAGHEPPLTQAQLDEQAKLWDGGSELIRGGPTAGQE